MLEKLRTIRAAWPMLSRAIRSGQILRPQCNLVEPDPDVLCEYDVKVPIGNGTVMTCNVFRSKSRAEDGLADPVVMCAHPYDNHLIPALERTPLKGPPQQYRLIPQSGEIPTFSTLTSWESPDPDFWVPNGYTLVNLNLPGYANSIGQAELMSKKQGEDFYEAIKWVAAQTWCDGAIGLSGVSYLAISQYHAAVELQAEQLVAQSLVPASSGNVVPQSIRTLSPIAEPRLDAASETAWYLSASPNQIDTIEYAYLEGQQGAYIETRNGFDVDGVEIKCRLDFGAKAIDWRGLYRNPGTPEA